MGEREWVREREWRVVEVEVESAGERESEREMECG